MTVLRTRILPKSIQDACVTIFMIFIVPYIYWFELFVVMPTFYKIWSVEYNFHFILGTYILMNIMSNYVAIVMFDTSIKGRILPSNLGSNTHFCSTCETVVPARSWHCNVCNICILKRDHHCMFTSCCIGHYNLRYFFMFILYLFVATVYSTYFNSYFIWSHVDFSTYFSYVKIVFPLVMLFLDPTTKQMYLFSYLIVVIGAFFTGVLLYFHGNLMFKGAVTHERRNILNEYDLGMKRNLIEVLGDRWYLVWLSPFVKSQLPQDGIHWNTKTSLKGK